MLANGLNCHESPWQPLHFVFFKIKISVGLYDFLRKFLSRARNFTVLVQAAAYVCTVLKKIGFGDSFSLSVDLGYSFSGYYAQCN